ncbi:MAG TPA: hypothetical protein VE398_13460 [Acidobacteriota bacterium]|nr:hypothetical protein [Acidobacteriota bacterium]
MLGTISEPQSRDTTPNSLLVPCLLVSSALALLVVIITFPTVPGHSCLSKGSGALNFSREGRTGEAGIEGAGDVPTAEQLCRLQQAPAVSHEVPHHEVLFPRLPRILRVYHFRPPPL